MAGHTKDAKIVIVATLLRANRYKTSIGPCLSYDVKY